jgi:hypothetical protein
MLQVRCRREQKAILFCDADDILKAFRSDKRSDCERVGLHKRRPFSIVEKNHARFSWLSSNKGLSSTTHFERFNALRRGVRANNRSRPPRRPRFGFWGERRAQSPCEGRSFRFDATNAGYR